MLLNDQIKALQEDGTHTFEKIEIGGHMTAVRFPTGRWNIMPYPSREIGNGSRWLDTKADLELLSRLTGPDALGVARALHQRVRASIPDAKIEIIHMARKPDRPVRFNLTSGQVSIQGGFPMAMEGVASEADRIVDAYGQAKKAIAAEIASWKTTTIDASYVAMAAGTSGLDSEEFFSRIALDPAKVRGTVAEGEKAKAWIEEHQVALPGGLTVRVVRRTVTATIKTGRYTLDACRLIVKNSVRPPDTVLCAVGGQPLDALAKLPDIDGSELFIRKISANDAGKKVQMTVHFMPQPLRLAAAREMYDRLRARARIGDASIQ